MMDMGGALGIRTEFGFQIYWIKFTDSFSLLLKPFYHRGI
jgi:hypothetical protein